MDLSLFLSLPHPSMCVWLSLCVYESERARGGGLIEIEIGVRHAAIS